MEPADFHRHSIFCRRAGIDPLPAQSALLCAAIGSGLWLVYGLAGGDCRGEHVPVWPRAAAAHPACALCGRGLHVQRFLDRQRGLHHVCGRRALAAAAAGRDRIHRAQARREGGRQFPPHSLCGGGGDHHRPGGAGRPPGVDLLHAAGGGGLQPHALAGGGTLHRR